MNRLLGFAAVAAAVTAGLVVAGYLLTGDSAPGAREAMFWACGVVLVGSLVGVVPLVIGVRKDGAVGPAAVSRFLVAMMLRLGAVGIGAAAVVLVVGVEVETFLLWLAAGYLVFLIVDTAFALKVFPRL